MSEFSRDLTLVSLEAKEKMMTTSECSTYVALLHLLLCLLLFLLYFLLSLLLLLLL